MKRVLMIELNVVYALRLIYHLNTLVFIMLCAISSATCLRKFIIIMIYVHRLRKQVRSYLRFFLYVVFQVISIFARGKSILSD